MNYSPRILLSLAVSTLLFAPAAQAQEQKKTPYWASISTDEARMRKGPSEAMPVIWEYRRENLPIKVIEVYENWRKIEDPDGAQGWIAVRLLSARRTALVTGGVRPMRSAPNGDASVTYRAEPGVVGFLSDCANNWCVFDVHGKRGYIQAAHVWGAGEP